MSVVAEREVRSKKHRGQDFAHSALMGALCLCPGEGDGLVNGKGQVQKTEWTWGHPKPSRTIWSRVRSRRGKGGSLGIQPAARTRCSYASKEAKRRQRAGEYSRAYIKISILDTPSSRECRKGPRQVLRKQPLIIPDWTERGKISIGGGFTQSCKKED